MSRSALLVAPSFLLFAAACQPAAPVTRDIPYPKLALNQDTMEFGTLEFGETSERTVTVSNDGYTILEDIYVGMQMGVGSKEDEFTGIDIGPGQEGFTVAYDPADITCPEGSAEDTGTEEATADAKASDSSGGGAGGTGASGGTGGGGGTDTAPVDQTDGFALFKLGPGCSIPVVVTYSPIIAGEVWGSLVFGSVQADQTEDEEKANELPEYLRDPTRFSQQVYLHGEAEKGQGTIVVSPRSVDFGYLYPGEDTETQRIEVQNVGTGDLTLSGAELVSCDDGFAISSSFAPNYVLAAGQNTLVEVAYAPTDTDPAYCELDVTSNDPGNSLLEVTIKGNTGADPNNAPPTVAIRWPEPGYEYNSPNPLEMEVNIFDKNQPATSLTCKVKSTLTVSNVASCDAPDASGHVIVSIPRENFDSGIDTLNVVVTDANGVSSYASISMLINSSYPDSDDDGDAYGVESTPPDCDDHNRDTYPDAAEVYDGEDNDCDGLTDEGTEGADDDGDDISEADGDCNDYNAQAYPGAPERADSVDNDCDGLVDEGTTLYDDDGDGFAEVNNDCNDADIEISPAAAEVCDGFDNDCDGLKDSADDCVSTDSEPLVIGYPRPSQNACLEGEQISVTVKVFDPDGQVPTYSWGTDDDKGQSLFDNPFAQTVNFTCPEVDESSAGRNVTVYVLAQDPDGHQVWGQTKIAIYPDDYALYEPYTEVTVAEQTDACGAPAAAGAPLALLGGLGLAGALAARRRKA
ncbi:hypothetical protein LBMAG42_33270 [Deltaproteobacteria bacterium]|nr:hypothetical protein LBMAG42_33270 [Deltaproteobacteria bacterium]